MKYYTNPLVVTDHCTFSTTVSIMGIDSQGSNRGKCSCGECVEFVRGSGVLCGYCECVPVHHEKVTDPNSTTTSTTQDGQTTQPRNNLWNDVSLGWIPDPKGYYTRFSNSLLAEFYRCFWATCPLKENFRLEFIKERKRQSFLYYFHKSSSGRKIPASDLSSKRTRFDNNFLQHRCVGEG